MTDYLFLIFLSAGVIAVPIASRFKLGAAALNSPLTSASMNCPGVQSSA